MGPLFDEPDVFPRDGLAEKLRRLAQQNIFIGGSSWKYEGWLGQIYSRGRYLARGKFSRRIFEQECLAEYAETFPTVCGDFAFYQFPTDDFWAKLFSRVPEGFRFAFKVPEQVTCKVFPVHPRYGPQAGLENPAFLDPHIFQATFVRPLLPHSRKTALMIFEFGQMSRRSFEGVEQFVERLGPFLKTLPPEFRYAVEIRNPDYLGRTYFECLRENRVAHVYNAWAKMPELKYQMSMPGSATADFAVCRALLRRGRVYEEAVDAFAPYTHVQDPNPEARESMKVLIGRARENKEFLFLFVNNRLEGNAPATILSLVE